MSYFAGAFSSRFNRLIPFAWESFALPDVYVGTLLGQMWLLRGAGPNWSGPVSECVGNLLINGRLLVGPAGKVYQFQNAASAENWRAIAVSRARRELELACAMDAGRRAAWLAKKRARLARDAAQRIDRAAQIADGNIKAAVIADAGFALSKWSHYAGV